MLCCVCHAFYAWASGSDDRDNPIPRIKVNKLIDWLLRIEPHSFPSVSQLEFSSHFLECVRATFAVRWLLQLQLCFYRCPMCQWRNMSKQVRVFHQGFQKPRKRWKHEAAGRVLLLFRGVWNPWWNTKHEFLTWLLKLVWEFSGIISEK